MPKSDAGRSRSLDAEPGKTSPAAKGGLSMPAVPFFNALNNEQPNGDYNGFKLRGTGDAPAQLKPFISPIASGGKMPENTQAQFKARQSESTVRYAETMKPFKPVNLKSEGSYPVVKSFKPINKAVQLKDNAGPHSNPSLQDSAAATEPVSKPLISKKFEPKAQNTATAVMQLKKIPAEQIIGIVSGIEFGGTATGKFRLNDAALRTPQGLTLLEYAMQKIDLLQATWAVTGTGNDTHYNALLLSYAVDVVADAISRTDVVYLPRIKPLITARLIEAFSAELTRGLEEAGGMERSNATDIVSLAQALNGNDPITLYMKGILPVGEAAAIICKKALYAGMEPGAFYRLLLNQFADQVLSLGPAEVEKGKAEDDKTEHSSGNDFPQQEMVGEISPAFYQYIGGESSTYRIDPQHMITKSAKAHLRELRQAIERPERDEERKEAEKPDLILEFIKQITGKTGGEALNVRTLLIRHVQAMIPQVTVKDKDWFNEEGLKSSTAYKSILSMQRTEMPASAIIRPGADGSIATLGPKSTGPLSELLAVRGPRYMRWRWDKDSRAEGADMPLHLTPVFGCLKYWDMSKWGAGGENYYGNVHFVLKPDTLKRANFRYLDSGVQRSTAIEVFTDVVEKNSGLAAVILSDVINGGVSAQLSQQIEVVIKGGINVLTDVDTVVISKTVKEATAAGIAKWCHQTRINCLNEAGIGMPDTNKLHPPTVGYHDGFLKTSQAQANFVSGLRALLGNPGWAQAGKGMIGRKTPAGIAALKTRINTGGNALTILDACIDVAVERKKKKKERAGATDGVYDILTALDTSDAASLNSGLSELSKINPG